MYPRHATRVTEQLSTSSSYNFDPNFDELTSRAEKISDFLFIRRINQDLKATMSGYVESKGITCLSVFLDATGTIAFDKNKTLPIKSNTIVITQSDGKCGFHLPAGFRLNTLELLFDTKLLSQQGLNLITTKEMNFPHCIRQNNSICMSKQMSLRSIDIIHSLLQYKANDIGSKLLIQAKALELLSENLLCSQCSNRRTIQSGLHTTKIHQAAEFIKDNYHQSLTIQSISRKVGLNEKKLKDGFREILSTTVHSYIEHTRLGVARQRLEEGKRITEIAFEVGYSSPSHFAKRFHKHFGKTPKNWQMTIA